MKNFGQFHDGFLDGLLIQGSTVHVVLSTDEREEFVLEVDGVKSLKVDGFKEGNIIYDVLVREGEELTYRDIMDFYEFKDEAKALTKLQEARQERLLVVEINPSYGASGVILAGSAELISRQAWMDRSCAHSS